MILELLNHHHVLWMHVIADLDVLLLLAMEESDGCCYFDMLRCYELLMVE
jgi:phosphoribosyl-AMP cyclohydrolase